MLLSSVRPVTRSWRARWHGTPQYTVQGLCTDGIYRMHRQYLQSWLGLSSVVPRVTVGHVGPAMRHPALPSARQCGPVAVAIWRDVHARMRTAAHRARRFMVQTACMGVLGGQVRSKVRAGLNLGRIGQVPTEPRPNLSDPVHARPNCGQVLNLTEL